MSEENGASNSAAESYSYTFDLALEDDGTKFIAVKIKIENGEAEVTKYPLTEEFDCIKLSIDGMSISRLIYVSKNNELRICNLNHRNHKISGDRSESQIEYKFNAEDNPSISQTNIEKEQQENPGKDNKIEVVAPSEPVTTNSKKNKLIDNFLDKLLNEEKKYVIPRKSTGEKLDAAKNKLRNFLKERICEAIKDENNDLGKQLNTMLADENLSNNLARYVLQAFSQIEIHDHSTGKNMKPGFTAKYRGLDGGATLLETFCEGLWAFIKSIVTFGRDNSFKKWKNSQTEIIINNAEDLEKFAEEATKIKEFIVIRTQNEQIVTKETIVTSKEEFIELLTKACEINEINVSIKNSENIVSNEGLGKTGEIYYPINNKEQIKKIDHNKIQSVTVITTIDDKQNQEKIIFKGKQNFENLLEKAVEKRANLKVQPKKQMEENLAHKEFAKSLKQIIDKSVNKGINH